MNQRTSSNPAFLFYCRAGFEKEVAEESGAWLGAAGLNVQADSSNGSSYQIMHGLSRSATERLRLLDFREIIFARQGIIALPEIVDIHGKDRASPLVSAVERLIQHYALSAFQSLWIEYPDTNEGKTLSTLARGLAPYLEKQLSEERLLNARAENLPRLHVFLVSKSLAWVGWSNRGRSSDWPLGIPRLRMPSGSPSRSTLKLVEAFMTFLGDDESKLIQPDMRAVDLGAAPGGWTWQLINRGVRVTAVDNGSLRGDLVDNAMVKHLRSDGFHFRPKQQVDWLVCDMVEQPSRIAALVGEWIAEGWARHAIFNLKLPMKKRLDEVTRCTAVIDQRLAGKVPRYRLQFKHLYHDREEITGYLGIPPRKR